MAGLRKDVELIFRGEDRASPTIKSVRTEVSALADAIAKQITAAEKGEGSIDDLAKAFRALKDAQGDVAEITRIASAYEAVTTKLAEQAKKVDEARAKEAALAAEIASAAAPTKRLQNARDAATRALDAAVQKETELKARVNELGAALDAAGGDSTNFAATQDRIKTAALETARAIRDAAAAMDSFKGAQAKGKANVAAQEEALAFNQLAAGSGLPQAQIQFIAGLENRLQALQSAIREDQASMAGLNAELRDQAATEAAQRVRAMAAALDEADASAERLKTTTGFKQIAADIEATAREVSRFGAQTDTAATSGRRLVDVVQSILSPTNAAANSLAGVNTIISQSETVVDGAKRRMSEYNAEINNLQAAMAGLQNMARLIDDFRQQEAAVAGAKQQFHAAQTEVLQLATAIKTAEAPTQEMVTALQQAEAKLESAGVAMQRETTKLGQLERGLESAKIDVNNLAGAEEQLTTAANRATAAQTKLRAKTGGSGNFLGLNPFELQNLGFQINDIVVGLASGQKPLTVLTQQGLQIGQIIPGAFSKIVAFLPELLLVGAALFIVASAIKRANDEASRLKNAQGLVTQMGLGAGASAAEFASLAKTLDDLGVSADKAREILVQLSADGLDASQMNQYIETAKALADVTGIEVPEAINKVRGAFQGGLDDILALDDETNVYTESVKDQIQQLYNEGKADEARALALQVFHDKMQEVSDKQRGPWKDTTENLSLAWNNFLTFLGNSQPIQEAKNKLDALAKTIAFVTGLLAGKSPADALAGVQGIGNGAPARSVTTKLPPARRVGPPPATNAGRLQAQQDAEALASAKARTRAEKEQIVAMKAKHEAAKMGLNDAEIQKHVEAELGVFRANEDKKDEKRGAAAAKRAEAQRKREARAAEAAARKIASAEEALARDLEALDAAVAKNQNDSLDERLSAIDSRYAKLFREIDELDQQTRGKGSIGGLSIPEAREHVRIQMEQLKNFETMRFYEQQISSIEKERGERLDTIADQVARGLISPDEGLRQSKAVIDEMAKKTADMAQAGLAFALSIRGAKPDPALDALIAKFQNALQNNSGGQNQRAFNDVFMQQVEATEARINQIVSQRGQLIDLENLKVQMGLQTQRTAQENIMRHYAETRPLILQHIDQIEALARAYSGTLTPEMQAYFDALRARIGAVKIESEGVNASFTGLRNSINQLLTSNIVGFIDQIAQSFAKLLTGKEDVMGFFASIGVALLQMIANVLQTVAMLIIEALILDAVDKATGGILKPLLQIMAAGANFGVHHEGGVIGDSSSGRRSRAVSPLAFAGAPRYHSGGIAGLAANENAAILKKGEEVLTESDPRHRNNAGMGGGGAGPVRSIRNVLAIGDDQIAAAMSGSSGEDVVLTHLRRNRAAVKQMLA